MPFYQVFKNDDLVYDAPTFHKAKQFVNQCVGLEMKKDNIFRLLKQYQELFNIETNPVYISKIPKQPMKELWKNFKIRFFNSYSIEFSLGTDERAELGLFDEFEDLEVEYNKRMSSLKNAQIEKSPDYYCRYCGNKNPVHHFRCPNSFDYKISTLEEKLIQDYVDGEKQTMSELSLEEQLDKNLTDEIQQILSFSKAQRPETEYDDYPCDFCGNCGDLCDCDNWIVEKQLPKSPKLIPSKPIPQESIWLNLSDLIDPNDWEDSNDNNS